MSDDVKPSIRLPERAKEILLHGGTREQESLAPTVSAMQLAILEELDRMHAQLRNLS